ncbi:MAG: hypothetical protein AAGH64_08625 [Planctomycetota bacterium]
MRRPLLLAVLALSHALTAPAHARAQPVADAGADARASNDPAAEFWLARLRQTYRTQTVAQDVIVTVEQGVERETEVIAYRSRALDGFREPEIMIDLGEIELWTRPPGDAEEGPGLVRAAHELDYRTYYEAEPAGGSTLETIRRSAPPIVLPQVALALGGELFPIVGDVTWVRAREERGGGGSRVTLVGETPRADVEMTIGTAEPVRVLSARLEVRPGPVVVTMRFEEAEFEGGRLGYDVVRRDRVGALSDLRERPGDRGAGDPLPNLPLVHYTLDANERLTEAYVQRLLLFYDGHDSAGGRLPDNASIGLDALRIARERVGPTVRLDAVGVLDPTRNEERHIQVIELDMDRATDPDPAFYTYSERRTLRRFVAESTDAIVVASKDGTIAGVIDLGDASERAERNGRDAVVEEIATRVDELCRLVARRARGLG